MDIEQIMKGYTKEDEFIARDLLLIELLIDKGIVTVEEVNNKYKELSSKIEEVKKQRMEDLDKRIEELKTQTNKAKEEHNG